MTLYSLERDEFFSSINRNGEIYRCVQDLPQNLELRVILIPTLPVVSVPNEKCWLHQANFNTFSNSDS